MMNSGMGDDEFSENPFRSPSLQPTATTTTTAPDPFAPTTVTHQGPGLQGPMSPMDPNQLQQQPQLQFAQPPPLVQPAPVAAVPTGPMDTRQAPAPAPQRSWWQACWMCCRLDTYQRYFDIDTVDIATRIKSSMLDFYKPDYFRTQILGVERNESTKGPDLYGPFWITMTLIFLVAATSNVHAYLHRSEVEEFEYDINHLLHAFTILTFFVFGVATVFWLVTQCLGMQAVLSLVDWICLYGYSMTIYIPAIFFCLIPWDFIEWVLLTVATACSVLLVVRNVATALLGCDVGRAKAPSLIMAILATHALFLLILKFSFYHHRIKGAATSSSNAGDDATGETIPEGNDQP